jgi:hypothetical protein
MDPGLRTPLLDFFRRGEVDRDIRLQAARGALAPRAQEQLALLILLVSDQDPAIARAAEETLALIPRGTLAAFLGGSDVTAEMREFFHQRGIEPEAPVAEMSDEPLVDLAPLPGAPVSELPVPDASDVPALDDLPELAPLPGEDPEEARKRSVTQRLATMTVAQRMSVAMKGSREERAILIRDPNKLVCTSVLSSPKLTESEIESIAKMANVSEEILRIVGSNRAWVKNYNVAHALARNPKTPVGMSMNLLSRLNDKDLRALSTNRNVPEILRVTARKKIVVNK